MQRKLVLEFTKMSGAGNDFIVIDNRFYYFSDAELSDLAQRHCTRRLGIGADGLLALSDPHDPAQHYRMRYFNADGSLGTMCGNGARCLARFAHHIGLTDPALHFESDAGIYRAEVPPDAGEPVRLYVPSPKHFTPERALADGIPAAAGPAHYIWTGTEHVVLFSTALADVPVPSWGKAIRDNAALAPAGANVNFVEIRSRGDEGAKAVVAVRTFEKGVEAETPACGTGALASALVARLLGAIDASVVDVLMPGGRLGVGFRLDNETIRDLYLEGPAVFIYRGTVEV